ncbi:hypothetical protein KC325_g231 [Hortaea werneckii]|nr:hypothetical protein KC325_g231 [Hortaea werneckii]
MYVVHYPLINSSTKQTNLSPKPPSTPYFPTLLLLSTPSNSNSAQINRSNRFKNPPTLFSILPSKFPPPAAAAFAPEPLFPPALPPSPPAVVTAVEEEEEG